MIDDEADEIKATLTSTMDNIPQNVLLSQSNDKNDANDSTPTSSTDAASIYSTTSLNASEDPISSTSSDVSEKNKVLAEDTMEIKSENIEASKSLIGSDSDVDLLDINITNVSSEPINEDVEDIVQDLENLLGESEPTKDYLSRRKKDLQKDVAVESDLVALENLVNEEGDTDIVLENEEGHTDKMTLESIGKEVENNFSPNLVQTSSKNISQSQLILTKSKTENLDFENEQSEKLNPKSVETDPEVCEEISEKIQEQLIKKPESSILLSDKDLDSGNIPNIEVPEPKESEAKCESEAYSGPLEEIDCAIKHLEGDSDSHVKDEKIEVVMIVDEHKSQVSFEKNVSENQSIEEVPNENEDECFDSNTESSREYSETKQSSTNVMNMPSLESEDISQDIEIASDNKNQLAAHNTDMPEITSLVSEKETELVNLQKPILDKITKQSSEGSLEMDGEKSGLPDANNKIVVESHESSENIPSEISYATTEESVDIDEIVKSAVDDAIESSASPTLVTKEEKEISDEMTDFPVDSVDVIEDPVSAVDILLHKVEAEDTPKSEEIIEELFAEVLPEISEAIGESVQSVSGEAAEKYSLSSQDDQTGFQQKVQSEVIVPSDSSPLDSNLSITQNSEKLSESVTEELSVDVSEPLAKEISKPIAEETMEALKESDITLAVEDEPNSVSQNQLLSAESNVPDNADTVFENETETLIENKTETLIENRTETLIENRTETLIENKTETLIENETETLIENKTETLIENKTETVTDDKVEFAVESKLGLSEVQLSADDESDPVPKDEVELAVEEKTESFAKTEIGLKSIVENETISEDENKNDPENESGSNIIHEIAYEPVITVEKEPIVEDATELAEDIECGSVVEDDTGTILDNVTGQNAQDLTPVVEVETSKNVEEDKTKSVVHVEETECTVPEETVLSLEDRTETAESIAVLEGGIELELKGKDELVMEDEADKIVEQDSKAVIKDDVKIIMEYETCSTTNDKPQSELEDASGVVEDTSKNLYKDKSPQVLEEVSAIIPIEITRSIEETCEPDTKIATNTSEPVIDELDKSSSSFQKSNIKVQEELESGLEELKSDENLEVAQVNEISSASVLEKTHTSDINPFDKTKISEITNESSEILENMETTKEEIIKRNSDEGRESFEQKELIPVVEEFIVKKTIIYEHDCQHKSAHEDELEEQKVKDKMETIHTKCPKGKSKAADVINPQDLDDDKCREQFEVNLKDNNPSSESLSSAQSSESQEEVNRVEFHSNLSDKNCIAQKLNLPEDNGEKVLSVETKEESQAVIVDSIDNKIIKKLNDEDISGNNKFEKNDSGIDEINTKQLEKDEQRLEVEDTSLVRSQNIVTESKVLELSSHCKPSKKQVSQTQIDLSDDKLSNAIQDQTTAAVQSILDNMLAEEQSVVLISNKEEAPVVHSSYSSYELQKAVQQIQDISKMDETENTSPEDVSYITDIEKPKEPEEIVQMIEAESSEVNTEDSEQKCVESIEAESTTITCSLSEQKSVDEFERESSADVGDIESPQPSVSKNVVDEYQETKVEIKPKDSFQIRESDLEAVKAVSSTQSPGKHVEIESELRNKTKIEIPLVHPSIDLSEESSNEDCSESESIHDKVSSTVPTVMSPKKCEGDIEEKATEIPTVKIVSKTETIMECASVKNDVKKNSPRETRHSSRISERTKDKSHNSKENIIEPLTINIDELEKDKNCSPKVIVKSKEDEPVDDREEHKGSLKITITKQSDNTHSILKICSPDAELRHKPSENDETNVLPKLVIKTADADLHSPKMSTRSSKTFTANISQKSGSPRITIKPIPKPENKESITSPLKITIKPLGKPEEFSKQQQKHSPKVPKSKLEDDHYGTRSKILKSSENSEVHSHKVIIKPIVKSPEDCEQISTPKITIKPFEKPDNEAKISPKITIKPVMRPVDIPSEIDDEIKERIVLKINKGTLPSKDIDKANRESRKREHEDDKSEKLAKIKLKFSKGGDAHIVHEGDVERRSPSNKRIYDAESSEKNKRTRCDIPDNNSDEDVKIVEDRQSPIVISEDSRSQDSIIVIEEGNDGPPVNAKNSAVPVAVASTAHVPRKRGRPRKVPLVAREDFGNLLKEESLSVAASTDLDQIVPPTQETETSGRPKRSCRGQSVRDTLGIKPRKPKAPSKPRGAKRGTGLNAISMKSKKGQKFSEGKLELIKSSLTEEAVQAAQIVSISKVVSSGLLEKILDRQDTTVKKPIELKGLLEAAKDQNIIEIIEVDSPSCSPKNISGEVDNVLDIDAEILCEENIDKDVDNPKNTVEIECCINEVDSTRNDIDLTKDDVDSNKGLSELGAVDAVVSNVEMQPPTPVFAPPLSEASAMDISQSTDIAMFEEETRMSAEASSRAETPAKQVVSADMVVEESQSSVQSTATTESGKISRKSRLEVHQEADGSVLTADQLNEYYWAGNGPFMIQEQVAQFLGIKSFKRKYPTIPRRMVDMQERDYIRENGLASESMCDLGLTAVNSADILDIMYSDFQEKYEEFCKFQRDKQAKDLLNKQRALSQAASQERTKLDLVEQAVHSAALYNSNFNRARKEHRRACMDLQSMSVHYPKGKMRQISLTKMGNYPVAVVPGQYTDYYKEFTPTELNNLPINTMLYTELHKILPEVSDSDSDSSGSDSDDSSSSGSDSGSSCGDNCKLCSNHDKRSTTSRKSPIHASV